MSPDTIIKKSVCVNCANKCSRILVPVVEPHKEYIEDIYKIKTDDVGFKISSHMCLVCDMEIDAIVLQCDRFIANQIF